jgi:hypothetical protein
MALFPMAVRVEIQINGSWIDTSKDVFERDGINITGGSQTKTPGDTPQPAQCLLTFDNRSGNYSPNNASGIFYPYLKRNVQLRVSVQGAQSSSGNTYTGYRFWGEVSTWPPQSDLSGNDIFVQVTATGPLRRLSTAGGKGSALQRYYSTLMGSFAPVAYWPCEEDANTTQIQAGLSGGSQMVITGTPTWKAISSFNGSIPIGVVNNSTWDGLTGSFGSSGNDVFTVPGTYPWIASTSTVDARAWGPGGGGENGFNHGGNAAGGGGYSRASALAVTIGKQYFLVVGAPGTGGPLDNNGNNNDGQIGNDTIIPGDSVTVTGQAGNPGTSAGGGTGGTGSGGGTNFTGGTGASFTAGNGGQGGGSSAGTAANGNAGVSAGGIAGGNGGAAPTGGAAGGRGGDAPSDANITLGGSPGGGGSGGAHNTGSGAAHGGTPGGAGQIQMIYTPQTQPTTNVIRFILFVPKHGGNPNKVILRAFTSSTVLNRLDFTYVTAGKLRVQGFNASSVQTFDTTAQAWGIDNQAIMVSLEFQNSGANVSYAFRSIVPGSKTLLGSTTGTVTTAAVGNVSEIIVGPNGDITKTAVAHISLQYALIPLRTVSRALHGHTTEVGIDRFIRLCNEEIMGNEPGYSETNDHWGFETGTQSWVATNGALTNPTTAFTPTTAENSRVFTSWPSEGTHHLLLTANGGGSPSAHSPSGTSGKNILPGDQVSVAVDIYTDAAQNNIYTGIQFYTAAGATVGAEVDSTDYVTIAGEMSTAEIKAIAPATSAFFAIFCGNHGTIANGQLIRIDNVRVHPRLGAQTHKAVKDFMKEVKDLDQGILRESRKLWGLGYRTRINLINQSPAVTLDYSQGMLSDPLQPVLDDQNIANDIVVHRYKGSKVRVTLDNGTMSVQEPPAGNGRKRKVIKMVAEADEQLLALASQLLSLGTVSDERYPTINVNLGRCGIAGHPLAPLMSAMAGVECGDYVRLTNLPFWFPSSTVKQLVIGYTETITQVDWEISWNCTPESPYEITLTNLRRW